VREQVALGCGMDDRIQWSGPALVLDTQMTVHLALVLHELAANARKHGALSVPQGRLSVRCEVRANGQLHLKWEESGGPQVKAPSERGFGSALIERTLRGHGGEATIRYDRDGVVCELFLPLAEQVEAKNPSTLDRHAPPAVNYSRLSLHGKRVVIVEDEPLVSMELESMLTAAGCAVVATAGTAEKAEALVARAECDAALLDMNLGGRPVLDLAEKLTEREVPFAFVSGYGSGGLPDEFHDALVVPKPVSAGQLLSAVEHLVRGGAPSPASRKKAASR
jgi:CheY-like chemotaxis protein